MLYIFHVDTGTMMTFDMSLALESVGQLKHAIEKAHRIPVDKQVLLVSGGECLDPCTKVCSYSAGTDTNPIFLFNKCILEKTKPPSPSIDYGSDSNMKELVDNSLIMPATYNTIVKRTQIAQQFFDLAKEHSLVCQGLVHDQHLQQQGWAAAVANLEDITADLKAKIEMFERNYKQYLETREENLKALVNFNSDLQILAKIPILKPLVENALSFCTAEEKKKLEEQSMVNSQEDEKGSSEELGAMTLLTWISTADNQSSLEQVAERAQHCLEQFDENVLEKISEDVEATLEKADKCEMKEIKGLEERLSGLEQLMMETKKIFQEQNDLAQALLQNQTRAGTLNDSSVLPDLCVSHQKQLVVMLRNQQKLRDIRRRCSKAKEELSVNLYHRLCWVMYVENLILDVSNRLIIYHDNLKRLKKYLEIIRQVQRTPEVYVAAVGEVVRRRTFSQAFSSWANDLSGRLLAIYNEEYEKRKDFQSRFEGHFLQSLFPGLEDSPSPFAIQAPAPFDVELPKLSYEDVKQLQVHLPELLMDESVTKLSSIAQMFLSKSATVAEPSNLKEGGPVEEQLVVAVSEAGLGSKLDKTLLQPAEQEGDRKKTALSRDDKDFESETDTEEFEKVCQSPTEVKNSVEPKFEENLQLAKNEVQTLRDHLTEAGKLANETAIYLKTELIEMKSQSLTDKEAILSLVKDIQSRISHLTQRYSEEMETLHNKLQEVMESKESEVSSLNKVVEEKKNIVTNLVEDLKRIKDILERTKGDKEKLNEDLAESEKRCRELQNQLKDAGDEKKKEIQLLSEQFEEKIYEYKKQLDKCKEETEKAVAEEREKLFHDHNAKLEELKSASIRSEMDSEIEKEKMVSEMQQKFEVELNQKLDELRKQLTEEADTQRVKALKELFDQLSSEFKTEIESLRSRFKLMSAHLEKSSFQWLDATELADLEAVVAELKETAAAEKEKAVQEALEAEREKLRVKLENELKLGKARMEEEKQIWLKEAVNRAVAEKNNQIEALMCKQESLMTKCQKQEDTIRLLFKSASCPQAGTTDPFLIEVLEKESMVLSTDPERRKPRRITEIRHVDEMSASVSVVSVTDLLCRDAATSPEPSARGDAMSREKLSKSSLTTGKISITSCSAGDAVLVVWNVEHANYTILQETPTLYFLHSDCLDSLGLRPSSDGSPRRLYCTAEVVEKEYCHAKKSENRYKVPKGTKFYRVKVRPLTVVRESMVKSYHQHQGRSGDVAPSEKSVDLGKSQMRQSMESSFSGIQVSESGKDDEVSTTR